VEPAVGVFPVKGVRPARFDNVENVRNDMLLEELAP
jgi:hypothetical protein